MRAAGDDAFESFDDEPPRARSGDLSAPRSAHPRQPDPLAALSRFVAESAVEQAARARSRLRWQQQLALDETTWLGLLRDLAEAATPVVLATTFGRRVAGTFTALGADFVCIAPHAGPTAIVTIGAIAGVERVDVRAAPSGRAAAPSEATFRELLAELAADRPAITWHLGDGDACRGRLTGVGQGFIQLRVDGATPTISYLPIGDRAMISLDG
jgi:hypothetical protein